MRSTGYKCYNIKCSSCMGKTLCGESGDTALSCVDRLVNVQTNADRIRAMSDEELAWFLGQGISGCMRTTAVCEVDLSCRECFFNCLKQPAEEEN